MKKNKKRPHTGERTYMDNNNHCNTKHNQHKETYIIYELNLEDAQLI